MKRSLATLLCIPVFVFSDLTAQSWRGWRFSIEPTTSWFFGTGNRVGSVYRFFTDIPLLDPFIFNYNRYDRQLYVGSDAKLGWRFEILRRGPSSSRIFGLNLSLLSSNASVLGIASSHVAVYPSDTSYIEGCYMFGQTLLPLQNDLERARTSRVYCGGGDKNSLASVNIFAEQTFFENDHFGFYPRLGLGARFAAVRWREFMRTDAVVLNYSGVGQHFLNHVSLDSYMRSRTTSFGPSFGGRIGFVRGDFNLELSFEQSVSLTRMVVDSVLWNDVDDIHIATGTPDSITDEGSTIAYLNGYLIPSPISEWRISFPREVNLRASLEVIRGASLRVSVFCGSLPEMYALRFEVPANWTLYQGTGWRMSRLNPSYCGAGAGVRFAF